MRFWAIEGRPGELLVDEAVVAEAVRRILGITTVEALFLFTSRVALDGFLEGFLADDVEAEDGVPPSRQALEAAFERELETIMGTATEEGWPRFPVFDAQSLGGVMGVVSSDVSYVTLDPDTPQQQVWSIEQFGTHLLELLSRA